MTSIFLSAVSKEFRSYRGELTHTLTRKGFLVKVQEDFAASYIRKCDICLVGDRYGAAPEPLQSRAFSHIADDGEHSYTQWKYILAILRGGLAGKPRPFRSGVIDYALETLVRQIAALTKSESPGIAQLRINSAQRFSADLETRAGRSFFSALGKSFVRQRVSKTAAEPLT